MTACCSAMPTSIVRSGNAFSNLSKPVGPSIAAVIATISLRSWPIATNSSENTLVQLVPLFAKGAPVSGSTIPTAWNFSASSATAGWWPRPFSVIAWTRTGAPNSLAFAKAFSRAAISWPSIGPMYFRPRSSNIPCGATISLMPFFIPCKVS